MKKILIVLSVFLISQSVFACTNIIVTKGASKDGSAFLFYTCDGEFLYHLKKNPAKDYDKNEFYYFKNYKGECAWERPISTPNASFSFIAQLRNWLPDEIGGILWFGEDDTYSSCYLPIYNSVKEISKPYKTGDMKKFSWNSAWWTFNFVSNYANIRYNEMIKDIQFVQDSIENYYIDNQKNIEDKAMKLYQTDNKDEMIDFLTEYCDIEAKSLMKEWQQLGYKLVTKYNDGYIKDENGRIRTKGYPDDYKREVLKNRPSIQLPDWKTNPKDNKAKNF